jgi:hypothetical protein
MKSVGKVLIKILFRQLVAFAGTVREEGRFSVGE